MNGSSAEPSKHDMRAIFGAFRLMASTSVLTLIFGIVSNKIVAVFAGPDGIATLNVYRNLTNFTIAVVSLGMTNVVIQRLSTSSDPLKMKAVLAGVIRLWSIEVLVVLLAAVFFAPTLTRWLFGDTTGRVLGLRIALVFVIGVMTMQIALEVLNGYTAVKQVARVTVLTSLLTLLTAYPLVRLGQPGLAMMMGLTCFVGAAVAVRYIGAVLPFPAREILRARGLSWRSLPLSAPIAIRGIVCSGAMLALQATIARNFGTESLGIYTSASLLEGNAIMMLVGFMRPYYLPSLGALTDEREKHRFVNRILELLILIAIPGIVALVLLSPLVLRVLFSRQFSVGASYLSILGFSMLAQVFLYTYAFYFIHRAAYRAMLWIDLIWASLLLAGTLSCAWLHAPIAAVAWVYAASYCVYAILYVGGGMRRFGGDLISRKNIALGLSGLVWLLGGYFIAHFDVGLRVSFAAASVLASLVLGAPALKQWRTHQR